jgi:hypothetical protein
LIAWPVAAASVDLSLPSRATIVATSGQVSASTPCIRRWNPLKQPALIEGAGIDDHVVARVEDAAGFPATDRQPPRTGDDDVE